MPGGVYVYLEACISKAYRLFDSCAEVLELEMYPPYTKIFLVDRSKTAE